MNWYKTSKLIDKKAPTDKKSIFSRCSYCERWATHNEQGETEWKPELSYDELIEMGRGNISHGICPICWAIIQKHNANINPEDVAKMSLQN